MLEQEEVVNNSKAEFTRTDWGDATNNVSPALIQNCDHPIAKSKR